MDHALRVHVNQRLADLDGITQRAFGCERALVAQQGAQRSAFDELHRDVHPAFAARGEDLDDIGMVQTLADRFLAAEALVEDHVGFELGIGHLQGDGLTVFGVNRREDRGHAAARDQLGDLILVEALPDTDLAHRLYA